jgi:hypothetical protein
MHSLHQRSQTLCASMARHCHVYLHMCTVVQESSLTLFTYSKLNLIVEYVGSLNTRHGHTSSYLRTWAHAHASATPRTHVARHSPSSRAPRSARTRARARHPRHPAARPGKLHTAQHQLAYNKSRLLGGAPPSVLQHACQGGQSALALWWWWLCACACTPRHTSARTAAHTLVSPDGRRPSHCRRHLTHTRATSHTQAHTTHKACTLGTRDMKHGEVGNRELTHNWWRNNSLAGRNTHTHTRTSKACGGAEEGAACGLGVVSHKRCARRSAAPGLRDERPTKPAPADCCAHDCPPHKRLCSPVPSCSRRSRHSAAPHPPTRPPRTARGGIPTSRAHTHIQAARRRLCSPLA